MLVVLLDDTGFAQLGCYGADIRTPTFDRLAANGLRYQAFHTTAVCAASRACLLTGRNHHSNALGWLPSAPSGFPGYHSLVPRENGFLSEVLRERGYATFAIGKWHLTPYSETGVGSSKSRWPLGRGFDRFYGFLTGETSQWAPELVYDNHGVAPPRTPEEGYHLNEDLADRAIEFLADLRAAEPDRPFFLYYCPGATHWPHHVPKDWADRYAGQFDQGWDRWREEVFVRQLDIGVVPAGTMLPPRPDWIAAWDSLPPDQRRLYARQMEVYAGFLDHTDHHIGRVVAFLETIGELDNTILIVTSDNGADGLDGPHGARVRGSRRYRPNDASELDTSTEVIDAWGSPSTYPTYSWGWAWAGNTPLRRWKRYLHEGGISDPLIVHWPTGIRGRGEVRAQYAHITDIAPTILDALGIEPPRAINGVAQSPIEGVSFAHTFNDPEAPTNRRVQYYELVGSRAIWADGWKAVTEQPEPVLLTEAELAKQQWELFHMAEDFSECHDLAGEHPDKLRQLTELWWAEAGRQGVLPLHALPSAWRHRRTRFVFYPGSAPLLGSAAVKVAHRSHRITANVEIPDDGAEGVLIAHGGPYLGGYALYVKDRQLRYVHHHPSLREQRVSSDIELPTGALTVGVEITATGDEGATAVLHLNGHQVGRAQLTGSLHERYYDFNTGLCCGYDDGEPVTTDYRAPFRFTGVIRRVVIDVDYPPSEQQMTR